MNHRAKEFQEGLFQTNGNYQRKGKHKMNKLIEG
jgi:hypothetical protein